MSLKLDKEKFSPKVQVKLDPPKHDKISVAQLAQFDGERNPKMYVAIKGTVFDVTRNPDAYAPGKGYHVFVGKDASRALAKSSLDPQYAVAEWEDLSEREKQVLDDWYQFFKLRYNIVGQVTP